MKKIYKIDNSGRIRMPSKIKQKSFLLNFDLLNSTLKLIPINSDSLHHLWK